MFVIPSETLLPYVESKDLGVLIRAGARKARILIGSAQRNCGYRLYFGHDLVGQS